MTPHPYKISITAADLIATLRSMEDARQRNNLLRFFKTGLGEYGEGDRFIGLKVSQVRLVVKEARLRVSLEEIGLLLQSEWHEARLRGFLLSVEEMKAALPRSCSAPTKAIYLRHTRRANNWNLVDMSCPKILGSRILHSLLNDTQPDRSLLDRLAQSDCLWKQRIAIVTCWNFIREGQTDDALRLSTALLKHPHDLIHKAVGWMFREVGKHHPILQEQYLDCISMKCIEPSSATPSRKYRNRNGNTGCNGKSDPLPKIVSMSYPQPFIDHAS